MSCLSCDAPALCPECYEQADKCPSCGVPYILHLGLIGTCADLQETREELDRINGKLKIIRFMVSKHGQNGQDAIPFIKEVLGED